MSLDRQTIALYHCDEGQGDVRVDSSENKHHGKMTGVRWTPAADIPPVTSLSSDHPALRFDFVENSEPGFIEIASLQLPVEGPLTIEGYVKLEKDYAGPNPTYFGVRMSSPLVGVGST